MGGVLTVQAFEDAVGEAKKKGAQAIHHELSSPGEAGVGICGSWNSQQRKQHMQRSEGLR